MSKIGDRVGAILGSNEGTMTIEFLGYGTYTGDFIPSDAVGFMGKTIAKLERTNPRIDLDSGQHVWGCECWWGSEDIVKERLEFWTGNGHTIVNVDIDDIRNHIL